MARLRTSKGTGHATRRVRGTDATVRRELAAEVRAWRAELLDELGWGHLAEVAREAIAIRYPELEGYDPF